MTALLEVDANAPAWLLEAQGFLAEKVKFVYEHEKLEDMPVCFGQIMDFEDGRLSYKAIPVPDELDKHEAYSCFRFVLNQTQKSPEFGHMQLAGFTIMEGWELDEKSQNRTGRTMIITNIESPDGWNAMQSWVLEDHVLIEHARLVQYQFGGEPKGAMQGMFDEQHQAS